MVPGSSIILVWSKVELSRTLEHMSAAGGGRGDPQETHILPKTEWRHISHHVMLYQGDMTLYSVVTQSCRTAIDLSKCKLIWSTNLSI